MTENPPSNKPSDLSSDRISSGMPPTRVLHIEVPEPIFNRAKAQSLLLGMKWPEFVVDLLRKAGPAGKTSGE
jgi:hypothetical protein